jgi:hypothetical protein
MVFVPLKYAAAPTLLLFREMLKVLEMLYFGRSFGI